MVLSTNIRSLVPVILLVGVSACTPPSATKQYNADVIIPPKRGVVTEESAPVVYESTAPSEAPAQGGSAVAPVPKTVAPASPAAAASDPPAVLALVQEADASTASGRLDNAAATLERGIRIQPRNGLLWQKLAEVRLKQNQPGLAEDLAKKSNVLAKENKSLTRKNWSIIAEARRLKGDVPGASEADAKAKL